MAVADTKAYSFQFFMKTWLPGTVAVVTAVIAAQMWMSGQYLSLQEGQGLQQRMRAIEATMAHVSEQNDEIIESLGFIRGQLAAEGE